ncbi:MAG: hypothetical protein DRP01_02145 [Archaeoglobales archaeon]|nr:MAG: hypothetical protein DRP01_02145 [Archaeoglobales archaeon]
MTTCNQKGTAGGNGTGTGNGSNGSGANGTDTGSGTEDVSCGPKRPGCMDLGHMAVGFWGRDIHAHVFGEQQAARERALLIEQILAGSIRANLWQGVEDGEKCGCYKEASQQPDRKCSSCYGVGKVPGFWKFGYNTLFLTGVDTDAVLTDVRLTRNFKSSKIELTEGSLSGMIESGDKPFSRSALGSHWEVDFHTFVREIEESSVVVEYSLDSGTTWNEICTLVMANPLSGQIRFRATLSRDSATVLSPFFEVIRARYASIDLGRSGVEGNPRMGPWILVMREPPTTTYKKQEYGDLPIEDGLTMWTAGLSLFDPSITTGSTEEMVLGPNVLIEVLDGAREGSRYVTTSWKNSDPFGYIITSQEFKVRIADPVEPMSLVW